MPTPYKQTDARWKNEKLGFGSSTIGEAGCTISCIGYLHNLLTGDNLNPSQVNAKLKAVKAFSDGKNIGKGNMVVWGMVPLAFPELVWKYRDYNYNNALVWSWINVYPRLPVLVENVLPGSVSGHHWRLFLGGAKCYNPLSGLVESTSVYKILSGSARYARK